jgi:hypothetical protein
MLTNISGCGIVLAMLAGVSHSRSISGSSEKTKFERLHESPEKLPRKALPE